MKKQLFTLALMMTIAIAAVASPSWPSWPVEPVLSWPVC